MCAGVNWLLLVVLIERSEHLEGHLAELGRSRLDLSLPPLLSSTLDWAKVFRHDLRGPFLHWVLHARLRNVMLLGLNDILVIGFLLRMWSHLTLPLRLKWTHSCSGVACTLTRTHTRTCLEQKCSSCGWVACSRYAALFWGGLRGSRSWLLHPLMFVLRWLSSLVEIYWVIYIMVVKPCGRLLSPISIAKQLFLFLKWWV